MADGSIPNSGKAATSIRTAFQFSWSRRLPMMMQTEAAECGLASLAMVANYYGHEIDLAGLRGRFSTSLKGASLARVVEMATKLDFVARPLKVDLEEMTRLRTPCLLHWDLNHFVVLKRAHARSIEIHDPARGAYKLSFKEASDHFTGIALELSPATNFEPVQARQRVSMRALTGSVRGLIPALTQVLLFAIALEVSSLVTPFYMQWVLDQVMVSADHDLLTMLGLGFLGIAVFSALVTAARSWAVTWLGATLSVQWASNLFAHLMKLPMDWFEKRHVGDVVSRFGSIQAIQKTLTAQFISSMLDGAMSLITLVAMAFYSPWLTVLVAALFMVYGSTRWKFFNPLRRANEEQIVYSARQQSELLESIRGAMPIKLANKQAERLARFTNATVATTNRGIGIQRLNIAFSLINQLLFGTGRVALVWFASTLALNGKLSVGMLVAFIAYADQFISRSAGLIDNLVDFRMLKLHTERVADIALNPPESETEAKWAGPLLHPSVELRNVSFRYAEGEPWILRNCNIRVQAGTCVAIVGPSGCGKSTLAKVILGLLKPIEGEVLFGGVSIHKLGLESYRAMIGSVMQDDQLFAGSITENISFFDSKSAPDGIEASARLAAIHVDIVAMPMGYRSLVGDMGSSLSGGQKQRIVLARALYRKPRLLILDEATSHLDVAAEHAVNAAIGDLKITRIVIAHRPETIASADTVIELHEANQNVVDSK